MAGNNDVIQTKIDTDIHTNRQRQSNNWRNNQVGIEDCWKEIIRWLERKTIPKKTRIRNLISSMRTDCVCLDPLLDPPLPFLSTTNTTFLNTLFFSQATTYSVSYHTFQMARPFLLQLCSSAISASLSPPS